MKHWIPLLLTVMLISGCTEKETDTTTSITTTVVSERLEKEHVIQVLEKFGYEVYGFDDGYDNLLGSRMIVGMVLRNSRDVNKQVSSAFNAMYDFNKSRDYYVVEVRDADTVEFFLTKGEDIREAMDGKINKTEFYERNKKTILEFYEKINASITDGAEARIIL